MDASGRTYDLGYTQFAYGNETNAIIYGNAKVTGSLVSDSSSGTTLGVLKITLYILNPDQALNTTSYGVGGASGGSMSFGLGWDNATQLAIVVASVLSYSWEISTS